MIHGNGWPDIYDYWILVGRNVEILSKRPKSMDILCSLADGHTEKSTSWKEWTDNDDLNLLSALGTVNHFVNNEYEITICGVDVLYETCSLGDKK